MSATPFPAIVVTPQEQRAVTTVIPLYQPAANKERDEKMAIVLFALFFVIILTSIGFGGSEASAAPGTATPQTPTAQQAVAPDARPVTITIEAEPKEAKIQIAAVSLGASLSQTGDLSVQVQPDETLGFTVSLDGYKTVQRSIPAQNIELVIQLQPIEVPSPKPAARPRPTAPIQSSRPQKAPQQGGCSH